MRSTIALLYVLAGPTGTSGFGFGAVEDIAKDFPDQQCLRHDGLGGCDGDDSIWEVFHEFDEILDEGGVNGEYFIEVLFLWLVVKPYQRGLAIYALSTPCCMTPSSDLTHPHEIRYGKSSIQTRQCVVTRW